METKGGVWPGQYNPKQGVCMETNPAHIESSLAVPCPVLYGLGTGRFPRSATDGHGHG